MYINENNEMSVHLHNGNFTLNLCFLSDFNKSDMKKICTMISEDINSYEIAGELCDYIIADIAEKEERRNQESYVKKMRGLLETVAKYFDIDLLTVKKTEDRPRLKKAIVYVMENINGEKRMVEYLGFTFQSGGYTFTLHKKGLYWRVSLFGVLCGDCGERSKSAALDAFVKRDFITWIKNNPEIIERVHKEYIELMTAAGHAAQIIGTIPATVQTDQETTQAPAAVAVAETKAETATPEPKTENAANETAQTDTVHEIAETVAACSMLVYHVLMYRALIGSGHGTHAKKRNSSGVISVDGSQKRNTDEICAGRLPIYGAAPVWSAAPVPGAVPVWSSGPGASILLWYGSGVQAFAGGRAACLVSCRGPDLPGHMVRAGP